MVPEQLWKSVTLMYFPGHVKNNPDLSGNGWLLQCKRLNMLDMHNLLL
jgi:hypothetical protein